MFKRIFSAALVFGAAALAPPLEAQVVRCVPRDTLIETLDRQYGERLTGAGLQNPIRLIEVWSSDKTGSFTIFITHPDGLSCVMATGQNWNTASEPPNDGVAGQGTKSSIVP
jgi:hypothetical protein